MFHSNVFLTLGLKDELAIEKMDRNLEKFQETDLR